MAIGMYPISMTKRTMRSSSERPTQSGQWGEGEKNLSAECVQACKRRIHPLFFGLDEVLGWDIVDDVFNVAW